jgi:hypothetical protein
MLLAVPLFAQDKFGYNPLAVDTTIVIRQEKLRITLPETYRIQPQTLRIYRNNEFMEPEIAYRFSPDENAVVFFRPMAEGDSIRLLFQIRPFELRRSYRFQLIDTVIADSVNADSIESPKTTISNPFASIDTQLKRSGSIFRGVNIGSNQDLTIKSGLNLQLSGNLTDDVEVVAALTDESTPIQPEGNTQSLREVDKVFIRFKSPWVTGVLGDFNLQYPEGEFAKLSRKLQGVSLLGNYNRFELGGTVASTRGFFNHMSFLGQEGNQGPYQLLGKNGELDIIILAGTERIWVDGNEMIRGEANDYVIDYASAQITFSNRRLVTSESRIEVDFEYYPASQKFTRNVYSAMTSGAGLSNRLNYRVKYYLEEDDPTKILEQQGILTDQDKAIIAGAGDDPLKAISPSAFYVGQGEGAYDYTDTTVAGTTDSIFIYRGEGQGAWQVSFSSVGIGKGAYVRDRIGVYRWVGENQGAYLPVTLLPLPQRQQLADLEVGYNPAERLNIRSEYALSRFDRNSLSSYDDGNNQGNAFRLAADLEASPLFNAGYISFHLNTRYIDRNFTGVDRFSRPDYGRYWNILNTDQDSPEEKSLDATSTYQPWQWLKLNGNLGELRKTGFQSFRYLGEANWEDAPWMRGFIRQEFVESRQTGTSNNWTRQRALIEKDIGILQPSLNAEREIRKNYNAGVLSGFEFYTWGARFGLINHDIFSGYMQYTQRKDEVFDPARNGEKIPQATTRTAGMRLNMNEWNQTSGHLELVLRKKDFTSFFEKIRVDSAVLKYVDPSVQDTVWQDRETILAELVLNNYQWRRALDVRWQYRISTELLALREKVFVDVGEGLGDFRYDPQLDEYIPDPLGKYVLFIVPTSDFQPVTNLLTSLRLDIDPSRYWNRPSNFTEKLLSQLVSESFFRIEEESKNRNLSDLYFLDLSKIQTAETIQGNLTFNQDLYVMKRNRDLSFRMRYRYRSDLTNLFLDAGDNENRLNTEKGIRADYAIVQSLRAQTEFSLNTVYRHTDAGQSRNRDIYSTVLDQNLSWRPDNQWEFGIESEGGDQTDYAESKDLRVRYLRMLFQTSYAFLQKGRISLDFDYQMVNILNNPTGAPLPYEMARGKPEGINKSWIFRVEYTLTENVLFTLNYSGRDDANYEQVIHSGQAEVRAYF